MSYLDIKFRGKTYHMNSYYDSKQKAASFAKKCRSKGLNAAVRHTTVHGGKEKYWCVYLQVDRQGKWVIRPK